MKRTSARLVAPESYREGIRYVESLGIIEIRDWLEEELKGKGRHLAGQDDDFPVQAILNHYPYFSREIKEHVVIALTVLVSYWIMSPETWNEDEVRHLLQLVAEVPVPTAKVSLKTLVEYGVLHPIPSNLHPDIFRTIGSLSTKDDMEFWESVIAAKRLRKFEDMARQTLFKIMCK